MTRKFLSSEGGRLSLKTAMIVKKIGVSRRKVMNTCMNILLNGPWLNGKRRSNFPLSHLISCQMPMSVIVWPKKLRKCHEKDHSGIRYQRITAVLSANNAIRKYGVNLYCR